MRQEILDVISSGGQVKRLSSMDDIQMNMWIGKVCPDRGSNNPPEFAVAVENGRFHLGE